MEAKRSEAANNVIAALMAYKADMENRAAQCETMMDKIALQQDHEALTDQINNILWDIDNPETNLCNIDCFNYRVGRCPYSGEDKFERCPRYSGM